MIENIRFKTRNKNQAEISIDHSTGETTVLLFNSTYPVQVQNTYFQAINELLKSQSDITPDDDLFSLFSWWFGKCSLETPLMASTFKNEERKRIGSQIKKIREENEIEAKQLALMTGINAANICRIEQGKHSVGIDTLSKIANVLGYKIELVKL